MASVDDRVVAMKFDNKQFEGAAQQTAGTLDKLIGLVGKFFEMKANSAGGGLEAIQKTMGSLPGGINPLNAAITGIGGKFLAASAIAVTAIANIVNRAVDAGIRIAKAFTLDPAIQGFQEYELKLNAMTTIMAGTGEDAKTVTKYLKELNDYSDQTIYSFADMTQNIGKFTNAGISLEDSVLAIKGIANVAAISGANAGEAARSMYNFAQSLSQGYVALMDWRSIELANMGTKEFKQQLIDAAVAEGTLTKVGDQYITKAGTKLTATKNFNQALKDQFLTSKVLIDTLGKYADGTKGIGKEAQTAAQEVKTFTQLTGTMKEAVGSSYGLIFEKIIGSLDESTKLFTGVNKATSAFIDKQTDAAVGTLNAWRKAGGRTALIKGLGNAFKVVAGYLGPIKQGFRDIFPAKSGKDLAAISKSFRDFMKDLIPGKKTMNQIRNAAGGLFAIFSLLFSVIGAVARVFGNLFSLIPTDSIRALANDWGKWLEALAKSVREGDKIYGFFLKVAGVIRQPIPAIQELMGKFFALFGAFIKDPFKPINERLKQFKKIFTRTSKDTKKEAAGGGGGGGLIGTVIGLFQKMFLGMLPWIDKIGKAAGHIMDAILDGISTGDFTGLADILNTGLFATIALLINKFIKNGIKLDFGQAGGLVAQIKGTFGALTSTLGAMQNQLQAKTLTSLAIAIAILVGSLVILSLIDSEKLTSALYGVGVAMGFLVGAMTYLTKFAQGKGMVQIPIVAAGMILVAIAVLILSAALKNLSELDWEEVATGMTGLVGTMGALVAMAKGMQGAAPQLLAVGLAMIPFAIGIKILAGVIKTFSEMSWEDLAKGGAALAGTLGILAAAFRLIPKDAALKAFPLITTATAIKILAAALGVFAGMSWEELAKAGAGLAGTLGIIAGAMAVMTGAVPGAVATFLVAGALRILMPVLTGLAAMPWKDLAKAGAAIGGFLLIMAIGLRAMEGTVKGSFALFLSVGAIQSLVPVFKGLAKLSIKQILVSLGAIAAVFVIMGAAAVILGPLTPVIEAIAIAVLALGAAMFLAGLGAFLFAAGFAALAINGTAGLATLAGVILLIPFFATQFAIGITNFLTTLASAQGQIISSLVLLGGAILLAIIQMQPLIIETIGVLLDGMIQLIIEYIPKLNMVAIDIIMAFGQGLSDRMPEITRIGSELITKFINGISDHLQSIIDAGTNLIVKFIVGIGDAQTRINEAAADTIVKFINGLAKTIRTHNDELRAAGLSLASAIISGMTGGLSDGIRPLVTAAVNLAKSAYNAAKEWLDINSPSKKFRSLFYSVGEGAEAGLDKTDGVERSARTMGQRAYDAMSGAISAISDPFDGAVMQPTITPVVDLSGVRKSITGMSKLMTTDALGAEVSYQQALGLGALQDEKAADKKSDDDAKVVIDARQYNTSPKALSTGDIYLNHRTQLGTIKRGLEK